VPEPGATEIDLNDGPPPEPTASARRRCHLPVFVGAGLVLAILLGVGAVVGWNALFAGAQPADRLPASVAAYIGIDLAPNPEQQARLLAIADRLPRLGRMSGGDALDPRRLIDDALGDVAGVDPRRDVTDWLGARFGAGAWLDKSRRPYAVTVAASTDDDQARAGLGRLRDAVNDAALGFVVKDHVALIAIGERDAQAAAEAAAAEAASAPLSESSAYGDARRWLDGDQLAVLWVDNSRLNAFADAMLAAAGPDGGVLFPVPDRAAETGSSILGVRATDVGLEARFRSFGSPRAANPMPDALTRLGMLPADSALAAVTRLPDDLASPSRLDIVSPILGFGLVLPTVIAGLFEPIHEEFSEVEEPTPAEFEEIEALMSKDPATLTDAERARLKELIGYDPSKVPPIDPDYQPRELTPAETLEVESLMSKDPATLTDAERARLKELLGFDPMEVPEGAGPFGPDNDVLESLSGATVSVDAAGFSDDSSFRAVAEVTTRERAATLKAKSAEAGGGVTVTVSGTTVTAVRNNHAGGASRLADLPTFQRAVAGGPNRLETALYVDLRRTAPPDDREKLAGLTALAVLIGEQDGDQIGVIRLIIS
jgi:hypothetical protein